MLINPADLSPSLESVGETRDGTFYRIRPIRIDDAERELVFIEGLSPESRYNRLFCGFRSPTPEQLDRWVHVDRCNQMAFVATIGTGLEEHIIGVARYCRDGDAQCEFAVVIADEWQGRGVGTRLSKLVFDFARDRGFESIHAVMLSTNHAMIRLAQSLGMDVRLDAQSAQLTHGCLRLKPRCT